MPIWVIMLTTVLLPLILISGVAVYGEIFVESEDPSLINRIRGKGYTAICAAFCSLIIWFISGSATMG